jgi:hypothetical protein
MNWEAAQQAFGGFMNQWADEFGQAVMRTAVGQYVSANSPDPVEVAIVVAQSGLELLGWAELVETGLISEDDWTNPGRVRASEKIRRLLDLGNASDKIPQSLSSLGNLDANWRTGPEVAAGVRNRLVHPKKTAAGISWQGDVLVDAWILMCHYLELALLRRLEVTSGIRNRLVSDAWLGTIETPPWV